MPAHKHCELFLPTAGRFWIRLAKVWDSFLFLRDWSDAHHPLSPVTTLAGYSPPKKERKKTKQQTPWTLHSVRQAWESVSVKNIGEGGTGGASDMVRERDCFYYIIEQTYDVGLHSRRHPSNMVKAESSGKNPRHRGVCTVSSKSLCLPVSRRLRMGEPGELATWSKQKVLETRKIPNQKPRF